MNDTSERLLVRGKRTDNDEWIEGYYVPMGINGVCIIDEPLLQFGYSYQEMRRIYGVDPSTVCQYAGIKDCHKKKIFEGDIFKKGEFVGIVKYGTYDNHIGFYIDWKNGCAFRKDLAFWTKALCICGNVFDNSDLLEMAG